MDTAYTVPAPLVTSSLLHCPSELRYHSADDVLGVVYFVADSASAPGLVNVIGLDVLSGEVHCSCRAAECGRDCWHASLVQAAWDGHQARILAARYNDDQLATIGHKAETMCRIYRLRIGRCPPADALTLLACRAETQARQVAALVADDLALVA